MNNESCTRFAVKCLLQLKHNITNIGPFNSALSVILEVMLNLLTVILAGTHLTQHRHTPFRAMPCFLHQLLLLVGSSTLLPGMDKISAHTGTYILQLLHKRQHQGALHLTPWWIDNRNDRLMELSSGGDCHWWLLKIFCVNDQFNHARDNI